MEKLLWFKSSTHENFDLRDFGFIWAFKYRWRVSDEYLNMRAENHRGKNFLLVLREENFRLCCFQDHFQFWTTKTCWRIIIWNLYFRCSTMVVILNRQVERNQHGYPVVSYNNFTPFAIHVVFSQEVEYVVYSFVKSLPPRVYDKFFFSSFLV